MLLSLNKLQNYTIQTKDREKSKFDTFLFEDIEMKIKYIVVDTGLCVPQKKFIISPMAIDNIDESSEKIHIALTKKDIETNPNINTKLPISMQKEDEIIQYFNLPLYEQKINENIRTKNENKKNINNNYLDISKTKGNDDNDNTNTISILRTRELSTSNNIADQENVPQLRSTKEILGYSILTKDIELGKVEDFIIDDKNWSIQYIIVGSQKWLRDKKVQISPNRIEKLVWDEMRVYVDVSSETIVNSPRFDYSTIEN
jgi:hypothetical protein